MSKSLNKSMLIGNLGADPEVRTIPSGARTATFSLATTRKWKNRETREEHEKTEWHRIVVWDGLVEVVEKYAHKGDRMYVEGSIEYRSYEDKDGVRKYITEIRARDIVLLGGKGEGGGEGAQSRRRELVGAGGRGGSDYDDFRAPGLDDDDDLPF